MGEDTGAWQAPALPRGLAAAILLSRRKTSFIRMCAGLSLLTSGNSSTKL
jgi:hypothetical protein